MKYVKTFKIFENVDLESNLKRFNIKSFIIYDDNSISVNDSVNLMRNELKKIPFKFRKISGDFYCSHNKLINLEGCPFKVGGNFNCLDNKLTNLEGCPTEIGRSFYCDHNNLTSLKGCPTEIGENFDCSRNQLTSLEHCTSEIGEDFNCSYNQLTMLDCSSYVKGDIYCWGMFKQEPEFFGDCEGQIKWK